MRALVVAGLVLLAGVTHAQPRTTPAGFDHLFHARNLDVKGIATPACTSCHVEQKGKLVGKPGHTACFGACHGSVPVAPKRNAKIAFGDRAKVCASCHAESLQGTTFTGKLPVAYPPYAMDPDFNISFGHKQHGTIACTQCHDLRDKARRGKPHDRCAGCHDGSGATGRGPAMNKCSGCHPQGIGKPEPPQLAVLRDSVAATFSHSRHASRGVAGKDCVTCHAAIRTTDDTQLPRPTTENCATGGCHDGKGAFSTTAACTRCHTREPERFEVVRPTARFLHAGPHAQVVTQRPCGACHALGARGDALVASHDACVECHAADFAARRPTTCGACHNATEPWRPLVADRAPPDHTEFGAMLDHAKHPQECAKCHNLRTRSSQLRPPRGHVACTGTGCHAIKSGPSPTLETCSGCHRVGLAESRTAARVRAQWSVRSQFEHTTHATGTGGAPLACTTCHTSLAGADLMTLPTPLKSTCAPCHDAGKSAFKLTGTTCGRCHATPQARL